MATTSLCNAVGVGLIPGQGAKIPHASRPKNQNIKQKQDYNKFNKDFKMVHIKKEKKKKRHSKTVFSKAGAETLAAAAVTFVVVLQSLSRAQLSATPWTVAHWASLSFTISQSLLTHVY